MKPLEKGRSELKTEPWEYQHLGIPKRECQWNSLEVRKESRQINITENQSLEYFTK